MKVIDKAEKFIQKRCQELVTDFHFQKVCVLFSDSLEVFRLQMNIIRIMKGA